MQQKYEILSFSENSPVRCALQHTTEIGTHLHEYFEVDLILSGKCKVIVDNQTYYLNAEDLITIESHTPHSCVGDNCAMITVQFEQSMFERTLPEPKHPDFFCNSSVQGNNSAFDAMRSVIARLVKNNADLQGGYELRNWALIYELMDIMYNNFRVMDSESQAQKAYRYTARISKISRIINENFQTDLTLSDLAQKVHLSAPYLSKFFEKHFGITFLAYLTQVRLNHALRELQQTDDTIETISANSGFPNSHSFVNAFKKEYGVLPSIYRRQYLKTQAEPEPLLQPEQSDYMAGLRKYLNLSQAPAMTVQAISARGSFDARSELATLKHSWKNVLAVNSAQAILLSDVQAMIKRIQREVGFRYIKFNGILSEDMHIYNETVNGEAIYSFTYADKVFDFILSVGLKPLVQLSFMPEQLANNPRHLFNYLVSEPKNNEKWAELVKALLSHLIERYGKSEVRKWMFTVWDQPDTPQNLYGFSSDESFYRFYQATYQAAKECDPQIRFGAPATYYILKDKFTNWYIPFLAWCRENGCMPEFLNFHYYDMAFAEGDSDASEAFGFPDQMVLQDTPGGLNNFVNQIRSECAGQAYNDLPIFLTEWNNTPSQQDLLNDTCFKSCYIVKGILENYDKLDSFGYWALTDLMGEAPQPKEQFYGGLGLFTANGLPKASYYAFSLLRQLGNTLIGRGKEWFATKDGDTIQIIIYNYRHFSHLYALGEKFDMTFTERYTTFAPEQSLDIHINIENITDGNYIVKETILNRSSGSAFDQWLNMGATELKAQNELDVLSALSVPKFSKYMISAENGTLELDAMLDLLEVRLLTIEPLD